MSDWERAFQAVTTRALEAAPELDKVGHAMKEAADRAGTPLSSLAWRVTP